MKTEQVGEKILEKIGVPEKEVNIFQEQTREMVKNIENTLKSKKISAEVFIGGSLRKGTLIRKKKQDADIFVRFESKTEEEIAHNFKKLIDGLRTKARKEKIHGSRDYYRIIGKNLEFEIVPVQKIARPEESKNTTDLSYFHVDYVSKKIEKNRKLAGEIVLAKTFTHACGCYGAESHIRGFSGYALELLIIHYKGFMNFIRSMANNKKINITIDMQKFYKNEDEIMISMNEAKLESPIVLVDPTFKERNALAALSKETFEKFKIYCRKFLKNPSDKFFEEKKFDEIGLKKSAKKKKAEFVKILARTEKQEGAVAGSKLLKFFNLIGFRFSQNYEIVNKIFEYHEGKEAEFYFAIKKKKKVIFSGPDITDIENLVKFRKKHRHCFVKEHKAYAKEKPKDFKRILQEIKKEKLPKMMGISKFN